MCLLAGAVACSGSSSSGGGSGGGSGIPTPTGPPPTSLHGHTNGGPDGVITAPASNPPSSGVPGGSEVFPKVDPKLYRQIVAHVLAMPGVAHCAYYPQLMELQVYYDADASSSDRDAVYSYITKLT